MKASLVPKGQHAPSGNHSSVGQFFVNVQILAAENREQAVILFGMLFTFVIWLFSVLGLLLATLFYVFYLWHHIPSSDGSLAKYCRRKVDKRLSQIVGVKINKAIERENRRIEKDEAKGDGRSLRYQPTLPIIADDKGDLSRHTSQTSFGSVSRSGAEDGRRPSALPGFNRPTPPPRMASQVSIHSADSYLSNAPLMVAASAMGYDGAGRPYSPAPLSAVASEGSYLHSKPGLNRLQMHSSQDPDRSYETDWSRPTPLSPSQITLGPYSAVSPTGTDAPGRFVSISSRTATPTSFRSQPQARKPVPRNVPEERNSYEMQPPSADPRLASPASSGYTAYNPALHARQNASYDLYSPRTATAPPEQQLSHLYGRSSPTNQGLRQQRSGTAPIGNGRTSTNAAWAAQRRVMDQY